MDPNQRIMVTLGADDPEVLFLSLWSWMHEFPDANLDDYAPKTADGFVKEMMHRTDATRPNAEKIFTIGIGIAEPTETYGQPCGCIGYAPITARLGFLHGVCFARGFLTREEKRKAFGQVLRLLFGQGVSKVCASYFADNAKIDAFLKDFGAVREGYFAKQAQRNGQLIDMVQVAIFAPESAAV